MPSLHLFADTAFREPPFARLTTPAAGIMKHRPGGVMRPSFPRCVRAATLALVAACAAPAVAQQSPTVAGRAQLFSSGTSAIVGGAALSPDGRWLAFSNMDSPSTASISVLRVGTQTPRRLTPVGRWDGSAEWSPSGRRIYFVSNRPAETGDQSYYGMVLSFDPAAGRATGQPRRVTSDGVSGFLRVSPDGQSLAYVDFKDRRLLKVMPAAGGAARVITRMPARSGNVSWSRDGQHLYFVTSFPDQSQRFLYRVPVRGGEPAVVSRKLPAQGRLVVGPGAETFLAEENGDGPRDRVLKIVDRNGNVIKSIPTNRNTSGAQIVSNGRGIVAVEANVVAPTRIMPVGGGAHRDVTDPVTYDWVMGWSPDGSSVYTWTEHGGAAVLAAVPVAGGASRSWPESKQWGAQGANSRYLFQATRRDGAKARSLVAVDLRDGTRHTISDALPGHNMILPYGPGGTWAAHEDLYFLERHGERLDVKAWRAPGEVRTLRSLPAALLGRTNVAVHGDRVAWQQERGDSIDVMIAEGPETPPRRLLSMAMTSSNEISFSNDGRLMALHFARGPGAPDLMAFVDPTGAMLPRIVDTGLSYWYWPRWLPDNSGVLVIGGGAGAEAHVVRIPTADGGQPVYITRADPASKWGFELSPDGRFIAYPGEIWKGSSVWRVNVGGGRR